VSTLFKILEIRKSLMEHARAIRCHSVTVLLPLLLVCFFAPAAVHAQLYTGSVTGLVTDPSGAVVPSAKLTLIDQNKGYTYTASTDPATGRYVLRSIPPGTYKITVEAPSFQSLVQTGITLDVNQNLSLDFSLKVGAASEVVEVKSGAVQVQTEDAVTGQVVNRRFVNDLPLVDRNFTNLTYLAPGITETDAPNSKNSQGGINFNSNGSRNATADVLIDGASASNFDQNSGILNVPYTPSVDSVEEFKVEQTNFSAEYGFAGGTIINVITRSGTNQFHGSAYEFFRNSVMDANDWFNNATSTPISPLKRNNFGGTFGGPIRKDKTFFFFDYEGLRAHTSAQSGFMGVPSLCERGDLLPPNCPGIAGPPGVPGNFAELCTLQGGTFDNTGFCQNPSNPGVGQLFDPYAPANFIPFNNMATYMSPGNPNLNGTPFQPAAGVAGNLIDPVAAKLFLLFPKPTVNATDIGTLQGSNFFDAGGDTESNNQFDIKVDHRFSDRDLLSVRYSQQKDSFTHFNAFGNFADPVTGGPGYFTNHDLTINHTHTFSPRVVLTITYGVVRRFDNFPGIKGQFPNIESSFQSLGFPSYLDSGFGTIPGMLISGYSSGNAGPNIGTGFFSITREGQDAHHLAGTVSWLRGKHEFKFGGEGRLRRINHTNPGWPSGAFNFDASATSGGTAGGDSMASFLTGVGSQFDTGGGCTPCQQGFNNVVSTQSFQIGVFAQDNYKVTPKLTLNLGLRYEINTPRTERFNRMNWLDPNAASPLVLTPAQLAVAQAQGLPAQALQTLSNLQGIEVFVNSHHRYNYDTDYNDIQPRLGFAYQAPRGFVVRGGYGIYYSTPRSGAAGTGPWGYQGFNIQPSWLTTLNNDGVTPWNTLKNTSCIFNPPFTCGVAIPPSTLRLFNSFNDIGQDAVGPVPAISKNTPYEQAWSVGFQKELPGKILVDATYIGKKGTHLYLGGFRNMDRVPQSVLSMNTTQVSNLWNSAPNPFFFSGSGACDPTHFICDPSSGISTPMLPHAYQLLLPFPQYTSFQGDSPPIANSIYHAAQLRVEKRFSAGLQFLMTYTWAKSLDDASSTDDSVVFLGGGFLDTGNIVPVQNPYNLAGERSESIFDIPQVWQLSYVYELPIGRGKTFGRQMNPILNAIVGGWQTNGIIRLDNGRPILPLLSSSINGGNQFKIPTFGQRPDLTGPLQRASGSPEQATVTQANPNGTVSYFANTNAADFANVASCIPTPGVSNANQGVLQDTECFAPFTVGNAPRTISYIRQPGARDFSMSIFKDFPLAMIREGMRLQFRAETFNTFNHPHFAGPDTLVPGPNSSEANFGLITSTVNSPRELQLALKLYF
jgi:carboxypeptidase family protein/TonB-dependent receptor-like protein